MRALLFGVTLFPLSASALTLHCGAVFDAQNARWLGEHSIRIDDGKIVALTPGKPAGDAVDHRQAACLPGFIDLHTHISNESSRPASYSEGFTMNPGDFALRAAANARKTLAAGFTTIRDLGDSDGASLALRRAIEQGLASGPRVITSGKSIATTGGHADPTNGRRLDMQGAPGPRQGVINGPDQAKAAVRYRYKEGSDWIKITATGGVLSYAKNGLNPQFTQEEANALVAAAKDYGIPVAAHAHGKEGMRRAILAGVTTIEHGSFMDEELHALMKQHGTWYVPTLMAGWWVASKADEPGYYPPMVAIKARTIGPVMQDTFRKAHAAGVKIAFGTDTGVSPHGMNAKEFKLMVDAGMSVDEALQSATHNAAEVLGMSDRLGRIAPGYIADLVVLDRSVARDVTATERPLAVYQAGKRVD
jgi:imidazolonepropionase-like amidohydrolase